MMSIAKCMPQNRKSWSLLLSITTAMLAKAALCESFLGKQAASSGIFETDGVGHVKGAAVPLGK